MRDGVVLTCREARQDGRTVGELEVGVFAAALIIDRDGILAEKAREAIGRRARGNGEPIAVAVSLPGASGYRADAVQDTPLPYVYAFAVAPHDLGIDGGVLVTIRSACPDWPAADHILRSLRILTRNGMAAANDEVADALILPIVEATR